MIWVQFERHYKVVRNALNVTESKVCHFSATLSELNQRHLEFNVHSKWCGTLVSLAEAGTVDTSENLVTKHEFHQKDNCSQSLKTTRSELLIHSFPTVWLRGGT